MAYMKCPRCGGQGARRWMKHAPRESVTISEVVPVGLLSNPVDLHSSCYNCKHEWTGLGFGVREAAELATVWHRGQKDLLGKPYVQHLRAVARGLADFDEEVQIAGWLHDILEDTEMTVEGLRSLGVPERSISAVEAVTKTPGQPYDQMIHGLAAGDPDSVLVKIADNAHNSDPHRVAALEARTGLPTNPRYAAARQALYPVADRTSVEAILVRLNASLLAELERICGPTEPPHWCGSTLVVEESDWMRRSHNTTLLQKASQGNGDAQSELARRALLGDDEARMHAVYINRNKAKDAP